tara:strand:- start:31 stop:513 length:483 start_codon:yes stop_codon:yes gene_type:complete
MLKKSNNILLIIILSIISLSVASAFLIQYWLDHEPCRLCIYQRIPYYFSILLLIQIIFFKKYIKIALLILSLIFFCSSVLAFYHFGIEQGFFKESVVCVDSNISETLNKEQILEQLKQNNISCKYVSFRILGFSLATINAIFSIVLSVIFIKLFKSYGKN